jgi:hypothetical protein
MAQVGLNGVDGNEQLLRDLGSAEAVGGEPGNAPLAWRKRLNATSCQSPGPRTGHHELSLAPLRERGRAAALRELGSSPQRVPRLIAVV